MNVLLPPAWIGIVGGGQLGMMLIREAHRMGYYTVVWDPSADCPASRLADHAIIASFDDVTAVDEMVSRASVITYEFENVSGEIIEQLEIRKPLFPGSSILRVAQHRRREKEELAKRGFPVVRFGNARSVGEIRSAVEMIGLPVVLKTATSGYDGKGQTVVEDAGHLEDFVRSVAGEIDYVVEEYLELQAELSVLVVRPGDGHLVTFPVSENQHRDNILHRTYVPARFPDSIHRKARQLAREIAESFDLIGLLCVEMFLTESGDVIVNELAPRPHNSGHYSLDACSISQFEALVRAICGLHVPEPVLHSPCAMVNLLGKHLTKLDPARLMAIPGTKLHIYGKKRAEPKRKMGHVTIVRETMQEVEEVARTVASMIGETEEISPSRKNVRV